MQTTKMKKVKIKFDSLEAETLLKIVEAIYSQNFPESLNLTEKLLLTEVADRLIGSLTFRFKISTYSASLAASELSALYNYLCGLDISQAPTFIILKIKLEKLYVDTIQIDN